MISEHQVLYNNRYSYPTYRSEHKDEQHSAFSPDTNPTTIRYARPGISTWATQLVGNQVHKDISKLTRRVPSNPDFAVHLAASSNGRSRHAPTVVSSAILKTFSISQRMQMIKSDARLAWYLVLDRMHGRTT